MKTAKQWIVLLLAGALLMGLCSCGPATENGEENASLSSQASGISEENALSEEESEGLSVTDMMGPHSYRTRRRGELYLYRPPDVCGFTVM